MLHIITSLSVQVLKWCYSTCIKAISNLEKDITQTREKFSLRCDEVVDRKTKSINYYRRVATSILMLLNQETLEEN